MNSLPMNSLRKTNSNLKPNRHSTGDLNNAHQNSHPSLRDMDSSDLSLSDLAPIKPSRSSRRSRRSMMDSSSCRTATTMGSSSHNNSSSLNFSTRRNYSWRSEDGAMTRRTSTREVRNLKGIRRRRSDPVTQRWREQCSKLYRQHNFLDSCPELPQLVRLPEDVELVAVRKIQAFTRQYLQRNKL